MRILTWLCLSLGVVSVTCHGRSRGDKNEQHGDESLAAAAEQIHLSFGYSTREIVVMWSSTNNSKAGSIRYGTDSGNLTLSVAAESWLFTEGNPDGVQSVFRARLKELAPGATYSYQVYSSDGQNASNVFSFTLPRLLDKAYPMQVVMFGDMGKVGGSATLPRLMQEVQSKKNVALIHVGDFAYDLQTDGGKRGDDFMNRIQDAAANIPYMTCPGNHEIPFNFSHYRNRFTMPTIEETPSSGQLWWGLDIGPVHFVSYDTELYFAHPELIQAQLEFLNKDLSLASSPEQRKKVPWIVAFGHRPMYCSNVDGDDCTTLSSKVRAGLEETFNKYGVDFIIEGHEHSYERLYPVFNDTVTQKNYINPRAPIHMISGQAGCNEQDGVCNNPIMGKKGDWSAFRSSKSDQYGYGRLMFLNATHAQWAQVYDIAKYSEDTVLIEQQSHGPF